jgi:hypothetical protein
MPATILPPGGAHTTSRLGYPRQSMLILASTVTNRAAGSSAGNASPIVNLRVVAIVTSSGQDEGAGIGSKYGRREHPYQPITGTSMMIGG